jgi:Spy/CpxP family protein refolding chaperone
MITFKSKAAALIGLALLLALPLSAQKSGPGCCGKGCGIPNLTAEQASKIQKLKLEFQKAMLPLQTELKTRRLEFRMLMMEGADEKKLEAKIDEMAKACADLQKRALAHRSEIRGLLTDEQRKVFDQKCSGLGCASGMGCGASMGCGRGGHESGRGGCGHAGMGPGSQGPHACGSAQASSKK